MSPSSTIPDMVWNIGGVNYLIPVDAKLTSTFDIDDETVSLDRILVAAGHVKKLSLIILDACRENPFHPTADDARGDAGRSMGLAEVDQTVADTLIAFAAKAGSVSYRRRWSEQPVHHRAPEIHHRSRASI